MSEWFKRLWPWSSGPNPRAVDVTVRIVDNQDPNDLGAVMASPVGNGQKLRFENDRHPGFVINFNVVDETGSGYVFPNDRNDALWAKPIHNEGESCPDEQDWRQFRATKVTNNNTTLRVRNFNKHRKLFKFALRFATEANKDDVCAMYDPVGDNQNGQES